MSKRKAAVRSEESSDDGTLIKRPRKRTRRSVSYVEIDGSDEEEYQPKAGSDDSESEYNEQVKVQADDSDIEVINQVDGEDDDEEEGSEGGFIVPVKKTGRYASKSSTATPSTSRSKRSTPRTSVSDDDEKEVPMSSAQATELANAQEEKPKKKRQPRKKKEPKVKDGRPRYEKYHEKVEEDMKRLHPETIDIFGQLKNQPKIAPFEVDQPENLTVGLLPFQKEGVNWLQKQEQTHYGGGILADEMGMGKTIQTVALMMSDKERVGPNLVVAPTVAMMQWKNEIDMYTNGSLSTHLFYGANRTSKAEDLGQYDVVLTTYAVCESVYRKQRSGFKRKNGVVKEKSVLHNMMFHRIVLDEAHNIKDRTSNTARAVSTISSVYKLCLSGTPLQNRIGELYSLLRFLQVEPFCKYFCRRCECSLNEWTFSDYRTCDSCGHRAMDHPNFFNHSILKFIQREYTTVSSSDAIANMRVLLNQIMLRRTKLERADDLGLPPRVVHVRRDYFNEEERDLYASIYSNTKRQFTSYVNEGVVLNNYANIFTLITRMRQVANHPDLVLRRKQDAGDSRTALVCKLCDDEAEDPIRSKCHHTFCRLCAQEYVEGWTGDEKKLECPVCHVALHIDLEAPPVEVNQEEVKKGSIVNRIDMNTQWRSSTKIEALVEELFKQRSDRQTIKTIVFSQFTSMLDLVEWRLNKAGFETVKLQGSMSPAQRDGIIKHFMETPSVEVFLVSLKAGGVALNLCEASSVILLDPWWNPSAQNQSFDRIHRIGQHRPVKIVCLTIHDSIESRIVELQEKKAAMVNATIGNDDGAMNRLTPADMQFLFNN